MGRAVALPGIELHQHNSHLPSGQAHLQRLKDERIVSLFVHFVALGAVLDHFLQRKYLPDVHFARLLRDLFWRED